jgi:hypothetical protein
MNATGPRKIPSTSARDWLIGILAGVALLSFVALGIYTMSKRSAGKSLSGVVIEKNFTPQAETQITVGKSGLHQRQIEGDYTLQVRVDSEGGKIYTLFVDKRLYDSRNPGDTIRFQPPPREP